MCIIDSRGIRGEIQGEGLQLRVSGSELTDFRVMCVANTHA